jgi:hypothetical protein
MDPLDRPTPSAGPAPAPATTSVKVPSKAPAAAVKPPRVKPPPAPPVPPAAIPFRAAGVVEIPGPLFRLVELELALEPDGTVRIVESVLSHEMNRTYVNARFKQAVIRKGILR